MAMVVLAEALRVMESILALIFQYGQFRVSFLEGLLHDDPPLFLISPGPFMHRASVEYLCFAYTNGVNLHELSDGGLAEAPLYSPPHVNGTVALSTLHSQSHKRCRTLLIVIGPQFMAVEGTTGQGI